MKPMRLLVDLQRRIDEAFTELIHEPWGRGLPSAGWQPAIDVYETNDAYLIEADLPGVAPQDVAIRLEGRRLSICGSRESTTLVEQTGRSLRIERARGDFCRLIDLESDVDVGRIEKRYEFGILHVRLPKRKADMSGSKGA